MKRSSNKKTDSALIEKTCKWAIMIYMAADDARAIRESFIFLKELDIICQKIEAKEGNRSVRMLLQIYTDWDESNRGRNFEARRIEIDQEFSSENLIHNAKFTSLGNQPMGTAASLSEFINWCKLRCNAENYLLFLWGHGTGSGMFSTDLEESYYDIKKAFPSLEISVVNGQGAEKIITDVRDFTHEENSLFEQNNILKLQIKFRGSDNSDISDRFIIRKRKTDFYKKNNAENSISVFDLLPDDSGAGQLNPETEKLRKYIVSRSQLDGLFEGEIRESLKNNEIDLLLIMGCCMQMVEFGYEIRKKCKYMVASEELIYFNGYNYLDSFTALFEYPDMSPRQLGKRLVQDTPLKKSYSEFEKHVLAISCVDLKKNVRLANYLDEFALSISNSKSNGELKKLIRKARRKCRHFGENSYTYSFIDLTWFMKKFNELIETDKSKSRLYKLSDKIIRHLEHNYIIESWIGNRRTPSLVRKQSYGGHGVGIYFPQSKQVHKENGDLGIPFEKNGNGRMNLFTKDKNWSKIIFPETKK